MCCVESLNNEDKLCLVCPQVLGRARLQGLREQQLAGLVEGLEREHHSQLAAESERLSSQRLGETLPVEGATPTAEQSHGQDTPGASGIV